MCSVNVLVILSYLLLPLSILGDVVHFLPPPPAVLIDSGQQSLFNGFSYLNTDNGNTAGGQNPPWPQTDTAPGLSPPVLPVLETTTRFSLPEIIINKSGRGGGGGVAGYPSEVAHNHHQHHNDDGADSIVVHNQYLPPPTTTTTTTTTQRTLFQDELNYYLPPSAPTSDHRNPNNGRGMYHYPRPPIQFDEPFIEPIYSPPVTQPPTLYLPPPTTTSLPSNAYLPPSAATITRNVANRTDNDFFAFSSALRSALRLEMTEMKCLNNGDEGFFRSRITVQSFINTLPVFEDTVGCNHRLEASRNQIIIQIPANEFKACGVTNCGQRNEELCARIRFPQIRGMRTVNDPILALQCKPQERIVSKTHALKMGISSDSHARSAGAIAQGGGESKFRTQVGIFRRSGDSFLRPLEANGVVQLGEDLMLRTQTKQGDGWNYTKITDISMQRLGASGEVLNAVSLVSQNGCINPTMKSVCTIPPQYEPPLGQRFGFKAVMFQGMRSGDEVVMSIRVIGCVNKYDCEAPLQCGVLKNGGRIRRSHKEDADRVEVTKISFRVEDPQEEDREMKELQYRSLVMTWSCIGIGLGSLGLIILGLMIIYHVKNRAKEEL